MTDPYDPSRDDGDDNFQKALAKQRLRKELGITTARPRNIGSSTLAKIDHNIGNALARGNEARRLADLTAEQVAEARSRADPEDLLTDADVEDVLEREGVSPP